MFILGSVLGYEIFYIQLLMMLDWRMKDGYGKLKEEDQQQEEWQLGAPGPE